MSKAKEYYPSGNKYTYISDIVGDFKPDYSPEQKITLARKNKDETYPAEFCERVVFGNTEISLDVVWTNPMGNPKDFDDSKVNLSDPLRSLYISATKFAGIVEFGQPEGDDYASKLEITLNDNSTTGLKWYKNNEVVSTDLIGYPVDSIAIAVEINGTLIISYAYIFYYNDEIWTSGKRTTADVLSILNTGGNAGQTDTRDVWKTEEGEFMFSKIYGENGNNTYSGVAARDISYTLDIDAVNDALATKCDQFGGWLGTDLISFIAGTESNAEGWQVLNALTGDESKVVEIPSSDGHVYTIGYYNRWEYSPGNYWNKVVVFTKDGAMQFYDEIPSSYRIPGAYMYLTWYEQSNSFENKQFLTSVYLSSNVQGYFYTFSVTNASFNDTDTEKVSNEDEMLEHINGYDAESGQEDDPQDEPDDLEDPDYDPLGSGFLFAFMVTQTDMTNLAEALVPDTLAQKIRADFGNNLYEFIVSYHMMPCITNADNLNKVEIAYRGSPFLYGESDTHLMLSQITKTWYKVDCGTKVCMPKDLRKDGFENWSNAHVQLYLPFIGYVHLNTADVWNKPINVWYSFDILQGTCVANVGVGNNGVMYSFEGSCKYAIPFTSVIDQSNQQLISGVISTANAGVSMAGAVASGSPAGVISAASSGGDAVGHFLSALEHKSIINRGGSLSGSPGWNMPRKPALIVTIPDIIDQTKNINYANINGYPTFRSGLISNWSNNYIECEQVDLIAQSNENGALPNDTELDMIKAQLKEGVYV